MVILYKKIKNKFVYVLFDYINQSKGVITIKNRLSTSLFYITLIIIYLEKM